MDEVVGINIHALEKRALIGDRESVVQVVSLERHLCAAISTLLKARQSDGSCRAEDVSELEHVYSTAMLDAATREIKKAR